MKRRKTISSDLIVKTGSRETINIEGNIEQINKKNLKRYLTKRKLKIVK